MKNRKGIGNSVRVNGKDGMQLSVYRYECDFYFGFRSIGVDINQGKS